MSAGSIIFLVFFLLYAIVGMPMVSMWWSEARGRYRELYQQRKSPTTPIWPYPYARGGPFRGMEGLADDAMRHQDDPALEAARQHALRAGVLVRVLLLLAPLLVFLGAVVRSAISAVSP